MINKLPAYASIAFLIIGILGGVPYDFYTLLRWVVAGSSVYYSYNFLSSNSSSSLGSLFALSALVFNPIIPVNLGRELWVVVDVLTLILFTYSLKTEKETK